MKNKFETTGMPAYLAEFEIEGAIKNIIIQGNSTKEFLLKLNDHIDQIIQIGSSADISMSIKKMHVIGWVGFK